MNSSIRLNDDYSERVQYNNPDYPIYIRRGLLSGYPEYRAPDHWHDDIEFLCVLSGRMKYNVNGDITELEEGDGIFVNARQMHFGFSDEEQECDFFCILLHPVLLSSLPAYENDFIKPLLRNSRLPFLKLRSDTGWHREILSRLYLIYHNRESSLAPLEVLSAFAAIWAQLSRHLPDSDRKKPRKSQDLLIIKNMVRFIQTNYRKKISLAEIAASGAVGQSKCCRLFARYFSRTPNEYLTHYRLRKSMELLHDPDMTVTEIALSTGFGSASYYAETFRRKLGKSPKEYRNSEKQCSTVRQAVPDAQRPEPQQ